MIQNNRKSLIPFFIGAVAGALVFIIIFGASVIVPTNTDWLFAYPGDATQHQLGWEFYRNSPADFPVGLTHGLTSEGSVSCLYSDSLPLFAIVFKLLSPVLPGSFQYFGLWGVLCFALNGGFGALLLYRIRPDMVFASVGSLFYSMFPPTLDRIMHHNSLGAIWLFIIPMILCIDRNREFRHRYTFTALWCADCALAAMIHPYFLPMIFTVMGGYGILAIFRDRQPRRFVITAVSSALSAAAALFIIGAFHGKGGYTDGGFGIYSSNLNTFFNGMGHSAFLDALPSRYGQGEGFGYLGLGALICCLTGIVSVCIYIARREGGFRKNAAALVKKYRTEVIAFLAVFAVSFCWAVSDVITLNGRVIIDLPLPYLVRGGLSIYRASGRFIWLPCILVITAGLAGLSRLGKRAAVIAAVLCIAVQGLDLRKWCSGQHDMFAGDTNYEFALTDEKWDVLTEGADEVIFLPMPEDYGLYMQMYFDFAQLAEDKDMSLSSFYLARLDFDAVSAYSLREYTALKNGGGRSDALYVFFKPEEAPPESDTLRVYNIDGYTVAKVKLK
ncbi:MAG: hypothetical protein IKO47_03075 [Ruminococcus sp.]|nr:hypothetical protein [Ruminococcus sp.]